MQVRSIIFGRLVSAWMSVLHFISVVSGLADSLIAVGLRSTSNISVNEENSSVGGTHGSNDELAEVVVESASLCSCHYTFGSGRSEYDEQQTACKEICGKDEELQEVVVEAATPEQVNEHGTPPKKKSVTWRDPLEGSVTDSMLDRIQHGLYAPNRTMGHFTCICLKCFAKFFLSVILIIGLLVVLFLALRW